MEQNRDMELIRNLLLSIRDNDRSLVADYDLRTRAYHVQLLIEAGYIEGNVIRGGATGMPENYMIRWITWRGHDFLDASANPKVWQWAKENVLKPGVSWSVDLLLQKLKQEAQHLLFPPTPPHN